MPSAAVHAAKPPIRGGALPEDVIIVVPVRNPVLMLDEIDKLGAGGLHGDPAPALSAALCAGEAVDAV